MEASNSTLDQLCQEIKAAKEGDSEAQGAVAKSFNLGISVPENKTIAKFWYDLQDESKNYREQRHNYKQEYALPLGFINVEADYARVVTITPQSTIDHYAEISLAEVEKQQKRDTLTYIVTIKRYDKSEEILGLMGARAVFGWTSSEARANFASLPYKVSDFSNKKEALAAVEELKKSGVTAEFMIVNGLGEDVTNAKPATKPSPESVPQPSSKSETKSSSKSKEATPKQTNPQKTSVVTADPQLAKWPKFCNQCGSPIKPGAKFCNECGNKIVVENEEQPIDTPITSSPQKEESTTKYPELISQIDDFKPGSYKHHVEMDDDYALYRKLWEELKEFKQKKRDDAMKAYVSRNDSPEAKELNKRLWAEYNEILTAIKGGARTLAELKTALSKRM